MDRVVIENNFLAAAAGGTAANTAAAVAGATGNGSKGSVNGDDWDAGNGGCEGSREQCAVRDGTRDGTRGPGHTELPVADKDPTGGKLENPAQDENKETTLTTPDQSDQNGASHTGNSSGVSDTGGNTTVTPIPDGPNKDDLAYLAEGKDNRLPIPEATVASNGLKVESNTKHTPGAQGFRPNAGIEPRNSLDIFERSIATKDPKIRLSIDSDGNIHRFFNTSKDGTGTFHWSGSTSDGKNALGNKELGSFNKEIKELKGQK